MTDVKNFVQRWHSYVEELQRMRLAASGDTHGEAGELIDEMHDMVDKIGAQHVDDVDGVIAFSTRSMMT